MKRANNFLVFVALTVGALVSVLAPGASAQTGSISGVILDLNAKPWAGLTVQAVSDQGVKQEAKTDYRSSGKRPRRKAGGEDR